jgi:hypothetical protein
LRVPRSRVPGLRLPLRWLWLPLRRLRRLRRLRQQRRLRLPFLLSGSAFVNCLPKRQKLIGRGRRSTRPLFFFAATLLPTTARARWVISECVSNLKDMASARAGCIAKLANGRPVTRCNSRRISPPTCCRLMSYASIRKTDFLHGELYCALAAETACRRSTRAHADTETQTWTAISKVGCFKVSDIEIAQDLAIFRL